jgi:arabinoxylan arabinofuranohydrolase
MKKVIFVLKRPQVILLFAAMFLFSVKESRGDNYQSKNDPSFTQFTHRGAGNPYLPLWEHLPDGEPRVFEDPDKPGKYRIYIIGSHDVRFKSYCGPDIRAWSAPVEDLSNWRDEGPIFTYPIGGQWDVMYAPELVEVKRKDGTKEYYLYPHSRGRNREPMVAKGNRPDGPFTPINMTNDGMSTIPGSIMGFDPAIFIDYITDPKDPDYEIGFRAYGFWGFQRSSAGQLDQNTMYSLRPGTQTINYFIPASSRYGVIRDPEGTTYPRVYPDENLGSFNFFEAASIRKIGNKFVWVYSGYSGPDYGLGSTNSALRYAYGDSPLGPWKSGGVLVDSRAVVPGQDGTTLQTSYSGHNTHGSIQLINDQWYVFYHRAPRGFGNARQPMVAPVTIKWDEKPVAEGGKVTIRGYNPYSENAIWTAKDSQEREYTGAEVTSEGFHIYGLDPYQYYSAGYACYLSNLNSQQDSWDIWDNNMSITNVNNGNIIGYKYFGFGGLDKDKKGLKAFEGTKPRNKTAFNLFLTPKTKNAFKVNVWLDGPWDNDTWKGKKIGEINVPANSAQETTKFTIDVSAIVDNLDKKHAIFLVAEGSDPGGIYDLIGLGFSSAKKKIVRPIAPTVSIRVNGETLDLPATPVRSTNANGIVGLDLYETTYKLPSSITGIPTVKASASDPDVKVAIMQAESKTGTAVVRFDYKGVVKTYRVVFASE